MYSKRYTVLFSSDQHTNGVTLVKHSSVKIGGNIAALAIIAKDKAAEPISNGNIPVVVVLIDRDKAS